MSTLNRERLNRPTLRKESVSMPLLGGEVLVREMLLDEKLLNTARQSVDRVARPGESEQEAKARAGVAMVSRILSWCVVGEDGEALMSVQEWREFGGRNLQEVMDAFNVAMRLSGFDLAEVEKN
jgi:hypothetical protein